MTGHDLRARFLEFFRAQGHPVKESDSLIPSGDPTVLFTSAGMNQFKDYFLGKRTDLQRAASCQKCLRTGDLERVGKSASHHSFFEMLGNFSFGDYFKREAIGWAWEFLTGTLEYDGRKASPHKALCLSLPAKKLWVSIYEDDDEAAALWQQLGVPADRIKRFGAEDNFWPANAPKNGPNGPCGPCSEIYYDPDGKVEGPKSVEIWNLVFTQFDRQPDGSLKPLPKPNIDTGMGLERLTRVIQGVETDYETALFVPIVEAIRRLPRGKNAKADRVLFAERAIADHLRAIVFLIVDDVTPSNESRGYVLRMLIRRAHRLGHVALDLQQEGPFLASLTDAVGAAMSGSPYHQALGQKRQTVAKVIRTEEEQFLQTLASGEARLEEIIERLRAARQSVIPGVDAFRLYDTYGFPLELTVDLAEEQGLTVDRAVFEVALRGQQERSRAGSQFSGGVFVPTTLKLDDGTRSEFIGYQALEADARVKGIWRDGQWAPSARAGEEVLLVLDRSPFYGESGGQVGDRGAIEAPHGLADIVNTTWVDELLVHAAKITQGTLKVEEPVRARVDAERRAKVARSHTATHLLHWALRKVLGPETVQAGSLVDAERLRFDFSALGALRDEQRLDVERLVNERVRLADPVRTDLMKLEEAKRGGAMALFGEKYGRDVRVVSIGDYSKELCGGTHLAHTGAVGLFRLVEESAIAAGTRRVEAVVGETAVARHQDEAQQLAQIARELHRPPHEALQGLEELLRQVKHAEKQIEAMKLDLAKVQAKELVAEGKRLDGATFIAARLDHADRDLLSALADAVKGQVKTGAVVLVSVTPPATVTWVMALTADLVTRGLHAGQMLKSVAALTQGGGGGRPEFAQAGGKDPSKVSEALQRAEQLVRDALQR